MGESLLSEATISLKLGRIYMPDKARAIASMQRAVAEFQALSGEAPDDLRLRPNYVLGREESSRPKE